MRIVKQDSQIQFPTFSQQPNMKKKKNQAQSTQITIISLRTKNAKRNRGLTGEAVDKPAIRQNILELQSEISLQGNEPVSDLRSLGNPRAKPNKSPRE